MNKPQVMNLNPTLGIGDLLITRDLVSSDFASRYNINIHIEWIAHWRNDEYANFVAKFCNILFNDDNINLDFRKTNSHPLGIGIKNSDLVSGNGNDWTGHDIASRLTYLDLSGILCNNDFDVHKFKNDNSMNSYSVLSTRVRQTRIDTNLVRSTMTELLSKYDKLILIGEKFRKYDADSNCYPACMEIINEFDRDRIVDLTNDTINLEYFLYENSICKYADLCVSMGYGGNFVRSIYNNSDNLLSLINLPCGLNHPFVKRATETKRFKIFKNNKDFLENIKCIT
jgi:hypothetical protein